MCVTALLCTWRVGEGSLEAAVVDEGIRDEEEVSDNGGNGVQLCHTDKRPGD